MKYVSEPELIVFLLGGFFVKCERWGNLHDHGLEGYFLRDYMLKAGIIRCPEVLSMLYPLLMAEQKLEEQDGLTHDKYGDQMEVIQEKMKQMELNAETEKFEEIYKLLLIFSREHGIME